MSWITVIWSMVASACLTLAAVHLLIWRQQRGSRHHGLFALSAVGTAALAANELWLMRADTAGELGQALRWGHVPFWVVMISLVAFVRLVQPVEDAEADRDDVGQQVTSRRLNSRGRTCPTRCGPRHLSNQSELLEEPGLQPAPFRAGHAPTPAGVQTVTFKPPSRFW